MQEPRRAGLAQVKRHFGNVEPLPASAFHPAIVKHYAERLHHVAAISKPSANHAARQYAAHAVRMNTDAPFIHGAADLIQKFGPANPRHTAEDVHQIVGGGFFSDMLKKGADAAKTAAKAAVAQYAPALTDYASNALKGMASNLLGPLAGPAMSGIDNLADLVRSKATSALGGRRQLAPPAHAYAGAMMGGAMMGGAMMGGRARPARRLSRRLSALTM